MSSRHSPGLRTVHITLWDLSTWRWSLKHTASSGLWPLCKEITTYSPSNPTQPHTHVWFSSPGLGSSKSLQSWSEAMGNWEDNRWHVEGPHWWGETGLFEWLRSREGWLFYNGCSWVFSDGWPVDVSATVVGLSSHHSFLSRSPE